MEVDDALCLGRRMGLSGLLGLGWVEANVCAGSISQQTGKGDAADSDPSVAKELSTGLGL